MIETTGSIRYEHIEDDRRSHCMPIIHYSNKFYAIILRDSEIAKINFYKKVRIYNKLFHKVSRKFEEYMLSSELDALLNTYRHCRNGHDIRVECSCTNSTTCLGRTLADLLNKTMKETA